LKNIIHSNIVLFFAILYQNEAECVEIKLVKIEINGHVYNRRQSYIRRIEHSCDV